jgi:hypothetical protein
MEEESRIDRGKPPPVRMVVGNKCDLSGARVVGSKEGLEWARRHGGAGGGCGFMETSAREMVNIEETFAREFSLFLAPEKMKRLGTVRKKGWRWSLTGKQNSSDASSKLAVLPLATAVPALPSQTRYPGPRPCLRLRKQRQRTRKTAATVMTGSGGNCGVGSGKGKQRNERGAEGDALRRLTNRAAVE